MRKILMFALALMLLLPTGASFAQPPEPTFPPPMSGSCEFSLVVNDLFIYLLSIDSFDTLLEFVFIAGDTLLRCWEVWLNHALEMFFSFMAEQMAGAFAMPPLPDAFTSAPTASVAPEDMMTTDKAERALRAQLIGNFAAANSFFCEFDQMPENATFVGDVTVNEVSCNQVENQMICSYDLTIVRNGRESSFSDEKTFNIIDERLCSPR